MANYLLKLFLSSGKFLSQSARKTLFRMIYESEELRRKLADYYEKITFNASTEENVLKVMHNRLEDVGLVENNQVESGKEKLKSELNLNFLSLENSVDFVNSKLDPAKVIPFIDNIAVKQNSKFAEQLDQILFTTAEGCLTPLQKNFDTLLVSMQQETFPMKNHKKKNRSNKHESMVSQINSLLVKNTYKGNKIFQVKGIVSNEVHKCKDQESKPSSNLFRSIEDIEIETLLPSSCTKVYKKQKHKDTNNKLSARCSTKKREKSSIISGLDENAGYVFLWNIYKELFAVRNQALFNFYHEKTCIFHLSLLDTFSMRAESKCRAGLSTEAVNQKSIKLKKNRKYSYVACANQESTKDCSKIINNSESQKITRFTSNCFSVVRLKRHLHNESCRLRDSETQQLISGLPHSRSSLYENSYRIDNLIKNLKYIFARNTILDKNRKYLGKILQGQFETIEESIEGIQKLERTTIMELLNIVNYIIRFNLTKHPLHKQLVHFNGEPFIRSKIENNFSIPLCLNTNERSHVACDSSKQIFLSKMERLLVPWKPTRQFYRTNKPTELINLNKSKQLLTIQTNDINYNFLESLKLVKQPFCGMCNGKISFLVLSMLPLQKKNFKQTNSRSVQDPSTEPRKIKIFKQELASKTELGKQVYEKETSRITNAHVKKLENFKPLDLCGRRGRLKKSSEKLTRLKMPKYSQIISEKINMRNFKEHSKLFNIINLNNKEISITLNSFLHQLVQMLNVGYSKDFEWLAENHKRTSVNKSIVALEHILVSQILSIGNITVNIDPDDIKERTSILEINRKVFDNMENDMRKIKIIDKPKKNPEVSQTENKAETIPTREDSMSFNTETQAVTMEKPPIMKIFENTPSSNSKEYFKGVGNQTGPKKMIPLDEDRKMSAGKQNTATISPVIKVAIDSTLYTYEINKKLESELEKNIFPIMRIITSKLEEPCNCLEVIKFREKQVLALLNKQLVDKVCTTKQNPVNKNKTAQQILIKSNMFMLAKKFVVLESDKQNFNTPATFATQHEEKNENLPVANSNDMDNKQHIHFQDEATSLTVDESIDFKLENGNRNLSPSLIKNSQAENEINKKESESQNSKLKQEQQPRVKNIYNKPPFYFDKHHDVIILPKVTIWNAYPRLPSIINCKSLNKGGKAKNLLSKKYRYETKEVKSSKGEKIRITCLISDNDT